MTSLVQIFVKIYPKVPLLIEVPVQEELDGPFLVSSGGAFLWVNDKFPTGNLRAAVRKAPREFLFREALERISEKSQALSWGSVNEPTKDGVEKTLSHLESYGFTEVEVLCGDGFDSNLLPEGVQSSDEVWVPKGWAVVLPKDKAFVGTLFDFGQERHSIVIHNASRGVGIIRGGS